MSATVAARTTGSGRRTRGAVVWSSWRVCSLIRPPDARRPCSTRGGSVPIQECYGGALHRSAGLRFLWGLRPPACRECGLDARKTLARCDQLGIEPARDAEIVERLGEPAELLLAQPALDIEIGVH